MINVNSIKHNSSYLQQLVYQHTLNIDPIDTTIKQLLSDPNQVFNSNDYSDKQLASAVFIQSKRKQLSRKKNKKTLVTVVS